jgi:hypothetical protein
MFWSVMLQTNQIQTVAYHKLNVLICHVVKPGYDFDI